MLLAVPRRSFWSIVSSHQVIFGEMAANGDQKMKDLNIMLSKILAKSEETVWSGFQRLLLPAFKKRAAIVQGNSGSKQSSQVPSLRKCS